MSLAPRALALIILCTVNAAVASSGPSTCKEAKEKFGFVSDGNVEMDLKVDSFKKKAEEYVEYCPRIDKNGQRFVLDNCTEITQDNFTAAAATQTQNLTVYCHRMEDENPLAYINVDEDKNYAAWVIGPWEFKTKFRKIRFDEKTQLVYTADYTFAKSEVRSLDETITSGLPDEDNPCKAKSRNSKNWATKNMTDVDDLGIEKDLKEYVHCIEDSPYVPFGTMVKVDNEVPGGKSTPQYSGDSVNLTKYAASLSMDFGSDIGYGKLGSNFLFSMDFFLEAKAGEYVIDNLNVIYLKVSESNPKRILADVSKGFVGVEVGNLKAYVNVINGAVVHTRKSMLTQPSLSIREYIAQGGWGIPLCMYDVETDCQYDAACTIPVNCLNQYHFGDTNIKKEGKGIVARTRPTEFGPKNHRYINDDDPGTSNDDDANDETDDSTDPVDGITTIASASVSSTASVNDGNDGNDNDKAKKELELGLAVGIPVTLLVCGIAVTCYVKRIKNTKSGDGSKDFLL